METRTAPLPDPAGLGIDSAFVVHVHADSVGSAGRTRGRIEHVPSGKTENFLGLDQMLGFIRQALGRPEDAAVEKTTGGQRALPPEAAHEPGKQLVRRSRSSQER